MGSIAVLGNAGGTTVEKMGLVDFVEVEFVMVGFAKVEFVEVELMVVDCSISVIHSGVPSFNNAEPAPTTNNVHVWNVDVHVRLPFTRFELVHRSSLAMVRPTIPKSGQDIRVEAVFWLKHY